MTDHACVLLSLSLEMSPTVRSSDADPDDAVDLVRRALASSPFVPTLSFVSAPHARRATAAASMKAADATARRLWTSKLGFRLASSALSPGWEIEVTHGRVSVLRALPVASLGALVDDLTSLAIALVTSFGSGQLWASARLTFLSDPLLALPLPARQDTRWDTDSLLDIIAPRTFALSTDPPGVFEALRDEPLPAGASRRLVGDLVVVRWCDRLDEERERQRSIVRRALWLARRLDFEPDASLDEHGNERRSNGRTRPAPAGSWWAPNGEGYVAPTFPLAEVDPGPITRTSSRPAPPTVMPLARLVWDHKLSPADITPLLLRAFEALPPIDGAAWTCDDEPALRAGDRRELLSLGGLTLVRASHPALGPYRDTYLHLGLLRSGALDIAVLDSTSARLADDWTMVTSLTASLAPALGAVRAHAWLAATRSFPEKLASGRSRPKAGLPPVLAPWNWLGASFTEPTTRDALARLPGSHLADHDGGLQVTLADAPLAPSPDGLRDALGALGVALLPPVA